MRLGFSEGPVWVRLPEVALSCCLSKVTVFIDKMLPCLPSLTALLLLVTWLLVAPVARPAQTVDIPTVGLQAKTNGPAPIVDSIEIDNRNIYDTSDPQYDNFIFRAANRFHRKTRRHIVEREMLLEVGAPYSAELAAETARNLRQRLPIYDAYVYTDSLPGGGLLVRVVTIDQWSLSGGASFRREANELNYWIGVTERNFLGLNQFVSATYFVEASEADHARLSFADNRLFGRPVRLGVDYSDDPRLRFTGLALSHPFYSLSQRISLEAVFRTVGGRRDVYADDSLIAQSDYDGEQINFGGAFRGGGYRQKALLTLQYKYRREATNARFYMSDDSTHRAQADRSFPVDSLYHEVRLLVGLARVDFIALRQIDGFGYTEDFTLGSVAAFSVARAMNPDSVVHNALGFALAQSSRLGVGLVTLAGSGRIWFHRGETLRRQLYLTAHYYNPGLDYLTVALRVDYLADWRMARTDDLILGGEGGLRGFGRYFRTGDRRAVLNAEGRFFPDIQLLSVLFGGAAFVDLGRTFRTGESLTGRDFYASVGLGLRVSFERTSRRSLFRCDIAYSEHNGWQLSISSGQYFSAPDDVLALTSR